MKLKVKLAKDAAKSFADAGKKRLPRVNPAWFDNESIQIWDGYLQGFEKAREMASILVDEMGDEGQDYRAIMYALQNLGEEEEEGK